jgi:hypothetical protein
MVMISVMATSFGQTLVHTPHPLQSAGAASLTCSMIRKRCACGPVYFGPGKRSVTAATGQYTWQIPHFVQRSMVRIVASLPRCTAGRWREFG